ncbi:MAG TPA: RsmB/NOP family class I SAM-dependent RNA methyltransferase [Sulfolobales archaeon]|nr:RsmB/NOP family class I SAM-dependent RNA methyltransferase [Sulfolobales archaeon]
MDLVDILSRTLYLVENNSLSVDVAFKKICRGRVCAKGPEERERIYDAVGRFVARYIMLRCLYPKASRKKLARIFISMELNKDQHVWENLDPWCRYSVPRWLYEELKSLIGGEVDALMKALERRVRWLRINTMKAPEEKILRVLEEEAVVERDRDLWYLYKVIATKKPVRLLKAVRQGIAIPQDKASCLVVEALEPKPGDLVLDMTSAPGMKASLIAMLTEGRARIIALDLSKRRALAMRNLMRKLGVASYIDISITDSRFFSSSRRFDKVLLDAPCSSSGAIAKEPAVRLHLIRRGKVEYYTKIQEDLLKRAIDLGDEVVYSTCSLLPEEGEEVVLKIVRSTGHSLMRPRINASNGYRAYGISEEVLRTFPHVHESEGFFIAKLVRR